jgi:hypothetical protein
MEPGLLNPKTKKTGKPCSRFMFIQVFTKTSAMKNLKTLFVLALATVITCQSLAQDGDQPLPRWVSKKGYWVVESNIHQPLSHQVRFYNNENVLLYRETVSGMKLDPAKKKVKMRLKKVLETALLAWEQNQKPEEDKNYVLAILK